MFLHIIGILQYIYIHLYLKLAYPMAMNEGKAHGLPLLAFDVPYSVPYQEGVIVVDQLDCKALAKEAIMLLKDYNYRKEMGEFAKKVWIDFQIMIIELWEDYLDLY